MTKQLAKGLTMLMLVMALAFVTAVVSANGQSRQARASVPFDFVVGDKTLASGHYDVATINDAGDCLKISNTEAKGSAARLTAMLDGKTDRAKLVFHRYGQRYFLAEVWTAGAEGRQLNKSRQERAIEREGSRIAELSGTARPTFETVEIAMN